MKLLSALALLMAGTTVTSAQSLHELRSDSKLWIEGGSNIRDWSCKATKFEAQVDPERISVKVVVRDLKCGNGKMEKDLYRALKADDPAVPSEIVAIFNTMPDAANQDSTVKTDGTMAVAGVTKSVRVHIVTERLEDGTVRARGSVPLLMTDFDVKPPTGLFGLIRSHNEIVVKFDLRVASPLTPKEPHR